MIEGSSEGNNEQELDMPEYRDKSLNPRQEQMNSEIKRVEKRKPYGRRNLN